MIAEKRRLARAVHAEHADLGVGVEGEVDVLEDLLAAWPGLGQALHVIDELARGHAESLGGREELAAGNIRGGQGRQGGASAKVRHRAPELADRDEVDATVSFDGSP